MNEIITGITFYPEWLNAYQAALEIAKSWGCDYKFTRTFRDIQEGVSILIETRESVTYFIGDKGWLVNIQCPENVGIIDWLNGPAEPTHQCFSLTDEQTDAPLIRCTEGILQ